MRLFTAVTLSASEAESLSRISDLLFPGFVTVRKINPDNYHITTAFIGESERPDIAENILSRMDFLPFTVEFNKIGNFGKIYYVYPEKDVLLTSLIRLTQNRLKYAGFDIENKKPVPHISIFKNASARRSFDFSIPFSFQVNISSISLMQSVPFNDSVRYVELYRKSM